MGSLKAIIGPDVYLDANIVIYMFEGFAPFDAPLRDLLARFDRGELRAVTSELTLVEVLVKPLRDGSLLNQTMYESKLRTQGNQIRVFPVTRAILLRAAELRAGHPALKLPDAIHAATALRQGCSTFLTHDDRFEQISDLPVLPLMQLKAE